MDQIFIHSLPLGQDYHGSEAYPTNAGLEVGIHSNWDTKNSSSKGYTFSKRHRFVIAEYQSIKTEHFRRFRRYQCVTANELQIFCLIDLTSTVLLFLLCLSCVEMRAESSCCSQEAHKSPSCLITLTRWHPTTNNSPSSAHRQTEREEKLDGLDLL